MFDWLREMWKMRGFKCVVMIEKDKRGSPIDVTKFLDFPKIKLPVIPVNMSCLKWVAANVKYQKEDKDYWKLASETLADGFGDCEDGAILLACLLLARKFEVDSTGVLKSLPYYQILVNVFDTGAGFHVAVTVGDTLEDWTNQALKKVPDLWRLWYCFNRKHAYTRKENVQLWPKR